eukprot:GHVN01094983.1.p1 GENE.GHVN01094983.1~~GHVN01094983.1.p1  ORF type:complete len:110 (+),score=27.90 GHVN01094983.1:193-522(+)
MNKTEMENHNPTSPHFDATDETVMPIDTFTTTYSHKYQNTRIKIHRHSNKADAQFAPPHTQFIPTQFTPHSIHSHSIHPTLNSFPLNSPHTQFTPHPKFISMNRLTRMT